ncbi:DNA polymerase III subunit alpha [Rubellimicrobium sp. CFH 75288]|uniref:DNA polymerase III subunit alpha n=1 Tax=Rubellimicrobium sp. CFH 75288 TaxID=2697034 RepID=UPI0014122DC1|nr:DNA polymerase III subunit alpha [Rubellimicrobium sp. CFH 75288]NAZ37062.1 DNA polymerase III subunit alpha [Rubellimicrobium sp. CFH 75288]
MADPRFIHLRVHSEHSLLEGAVPVKKLPGLAAAAGMPAVALTDTNACFAALEFSEAAIKAGVQPIVGAQMDLCYLDPEPGRSPYRPAPVVLLCQSEAGWMNLMKLNSCAYLGGSPQPQIALSELEAHAEGLICLTGGPDGPLGRMLRAGQGGRAEEWLRRMARAFPGRLYVELQRHPVEGGLPEAERLSEGPSIDLAYALDLPLVATNDVHFPDESLYEAHDALLCIADGTFVDGAEPRRRLTPQHWFKPPRAMEALFADLPEALENTVEIARRCAFRVPRRKPILPRFAENEVEELRRQAQEGLAARLAVIPHAAPVEEYEKRLAFELSVIEQMGFPGYFLIVADFIKWAKAQNIPVGPGRGSGAGSLVAYALTITDLDPLRYSLLFERFLNPERVSMPDFDIDFCMDRREEVIAYVQSRYGHDRVGQIITFGALLSKAAVRDVGRVLQMPYGQVDRLAKMIPMEGVKPVSVTKALADEPRLREAMREGEVVRRCLTYAEKLEGLLRNASTHAAGVVIADRPLDELVPLYRAPGTDDMPATQFNMKWVEQAGLVKFDFLGLKTLTQIRNAVDLITATRPLHVAADGTRLYDPAPGTENDIGAIPLDDPRTYELYSRARVAAVFQVESSGMMDALKRMRPTCIEDIVALVALYRPGPMENIPTYCEVKNGLRPLGSIHPSIDHILKETQGIIVYQEQVMEIARVMAGYSLGGADLLRRAMGKKIPEEMARERPKFIEGAVRNGVPKEKAGEVFDLLEKFANYGFNKSHAAAYAVVSYQTAWLKANHPVEFMAGVMNCDLHLTDKLAGYFQEVRKTLGIPWTPPCVNRSDACFKVVDGAIAYALGALKNVGPEAMKLIEQGRGTRPFVTLFDFARRVDLKRIGRRPLEMLARAGAFDILDPNRRRVLEGLEALVAYSAACHEQKGSSQVSLFGEAGDDLPEPRLPDPPDWDGPERLAEEFKAVGFYLSGHPLDDYLPGLRRRGVRTHEEIAALVQDGPRLLEVAGVVASRQERKSARGNRFAFVGLSDPTGQFEVTLFSEALEASRPLLEPGSLVVVQVEAVPEGEGVRLTGRAVRPVDEAVAGAAGLRVFVEREEALPLVAAALDQARSALRGLPPARAGRGSVTLLLRHPTLPGEVEIDVGEGWPVTPVTRRALRSLPGVLEVEEV